MYYFIFNHRKLIKNRSVEFLAKCYYTKSDAIYNGIMTEFSTRIKFKKITNSKSFNLSIFNQNICYDVSLKQILSF